MTALPPRNTRRAPARRARSIASSGAPVSLALLHALALAPDTPLRTLHRLGVWVPELVVVHPAFRAELESARAAARIPAFTLLSMLRIVVLPPFLLARALAHRSVRVRRAAAERQARQAGLELLRRLPVARVSFTTASAGLEPSARPSPAPDSLELSVEDLRDLDCIEEEALWRLRFPGRPWPGPSLVKSRRSDRFERAKALITARKSKDVDLLIAPPLQRPAAVRAVLIGLHRVDDGPPELGPQRERFLLDPGPRPGAVAFLIRTYTGKTIGEVRHLLVTPGSVITIGVRYDWVDLQTEPSLSERPPRPARPPPVPERATLDPTA